MMLYKLLNRGALSAIHGCISTGKEANVYYAKGNPTKPVANKKVCNG
jgi:RIO kinase 1